jgi:glutamate--cysteine ligase
MLDFVFRDGFNFETYARYALGVPMYFAKRGDRYLDLSGRSFRDFMDGKLAELPGERPTMKDWADHTTTIFPEVRLKQYLEMRGADSGPWGRLCALPALWIGVLYDSAALAAATTRLRTSMNPSRSVSSRAVAGGTISMAITRMAPTLSNAATSVAAVIAINAN